MNYLILSFFIIALILLTMWLGFVPAIILIALALIPGKSILAI
jgi:hypothetical protein